MTVWWPSTGSCPRRHGTRPRSGNICKALSASGTRCVSGCIRPPVADQHGKRTKRSWPRGRGDRKSTRLNSSHVSISYAVFCLKKKKNKTIGNLQLADIPPEPREVLHSEVSVDIDPNGIVNVREKDMGREKDHTNTRQAV